jgi:two-component system response regulator DesR
VAEGRETIENGNDIDVAVMDLGMPDGDGIELIEELRESHPDTSILVLTVDLNPKRLDRALEVGANEVVGKESSIQTIVEAVKRVGEV